MTDLSRLPPEFKDAIVKAALRYVLMRGQPGAVAHYNKLREYCRYARDYLAIPDQAEVIEAELTAVVQQIIDRRAA